MTPLNPPRWAWKRGRLGLGLFRATDVLWTQNGTPVRFAVKAPIPKLDMTEIASACLIVGPWLLAFFWGNLDAS